MVLCAVCQEREADQTHHLSYNPKIMIEGCSTCHKKIHLNHGVGRPRGMTTQYHSFCIGISDENHARLAKLKGLLMSRNGKERSYDDIITELLDLYERKIQA